MLGYAFNQCALFKTRSKGRLADLLCTNVANLKRLTGPGQYKTFTLPESVCEFTGKKKDSRNVEEPKRELRRIHDRIRELLSRVALVDYAHAAVKGRSYRTNAQAHQKSEIVANFDIKRFYPSTSQSHVTQFFFKEMKCSADVATLLGKILCYRSGSDNTGRLPTGSPASPIVSIYANKAMFDALNNLARASDLIFTCYVDDLTFSGKKLPPRLHRRVNSIVLNNGHNLKDAKTIVFGKGMVKHITGVAIKDGKIAVPHSRFFKARKIEEKISRAGTFSEQAMLMRKLSGLLGEAASIDENYKKWATESYKSLNITNHKTIITFDGEIIVKKRIKPYPVVSSVLPESPPPWD
ncbi:reverse transcriptase family protein [Delftia sp. DT-2]|jgi:hypothetical protein|uniref:reverse transcriptase family protein n=1 Tax=Delftia sp. DT-2 TaxID=3022772 RepID=UPI00233ED97A|nr:reverse transcriptase family protein [Delftia sp. DT-2]MDC2857348.1 reverse transcriptase family protein [Delftia sp. DT-2]MDR3016430.1 reverse transcriptase family protein [Delftia acidovorans]